MLGFFHDGLFIFGAFRPAPTSVFLIVVIGRLVIVLFDLLFVAVILIGLTLAVTLDIHLMVTVVFHVLLLLLEFLDEVEDGSILVMRDVGFIIFLGAFDLKLNNNVIRVNNNLLLYVEDLEVGTVRDLFDNLAYINMEIPSLL